jgi:hypothetical protein
LEGVMITAKERDARWRREHASHRHVKTQGVYILLHRALLEKDKTPMCVYQGVVTGQIWVRPAAEFDDGRFMQIAPGER